MTTPRELDEQHAQIDSLTQSAWHHTYWRAAIVSRLRSLADRIEAEPAPDILTALAELHLSISNACAFSAPNNLKQSRYSKPMGGHQHD